MEYPVEKNEEQELPIPSIWRPIFKKIADAFAVKDYQLKCDIAHVLPISEDTAEQIQEYIEDYGEELIELPEASWDSSIYLCQGNYWEVYIDLWTKREGRSDLCINAEVREKDDFYSFDVKMVFVP